MNKCEVLPRFLELAKSFADKHPGAPKLLRLSPTCVEDWRKLTSADWEACEFSTPNQDVTSLDRPEEKYIEALKKWLQIHVADVQVTTDVAEMDIVEN